MLRLASTTLLLVAPALAAAAGCDPSSAPSAGRSAYLRSLPLQAVDGVVKFGEVTPCGGPVSRTVRIRNQSTERQEVLNYASTCGCLVAKLIGDRSIGAGEERDVELTVNPGGAGDRSVRVEFATRAGLAGFVRADFSQNKGVTAVPVAGEVRAGDKAQVFELQVISNDGVPIRVVGIDPPVGSVDGADRPAERSVPVSISSIEALEFVGSGPSLVHPGLTTMPDGMTRCLRVTITTDHPSCPVTHFDLSILP